MLTTHGGREPSDCGRFPDNSLQYELRGDIDGVMQSRRPNRRELAGHRGSPEAALHEPQSDHGFRGIRDSWLFRLLLLLLLVVVKQLLLSVEAAGRNSVQLTWGSPDSKVGQHCTRLRGREDEEKCDLEN
jgi:hypothetical protein